MRALVLDRTLRLDTVKPPVRKPGEALVRVRTAGICNTDLELTRGYMAFRGIPGHEFVGVVAECDDPNLDGMRVVGEINAGCGMCERCRAGDSRHCADRSVLGILNRPGAFAEYLILPEKNLHVVPDTVDDDTAVFTEPLAAALTVFDENQLPADREIAVIGDGKLGLLVALTARARGHTPVLFGRHEHKCAIAADAGIRTVMGKPEQGERFAAVVECSGDQSGLETALAMIEPEGVIVLKSTFSGETALDLTRVVVDEIALVGSRCGRFAPALKLLERKAVDPRPLITARFPLNEGVEAFRRAAEPDSLKILLNIMTKY